jgi:hypothetical protein
MKEIFEHEEVKTRKGIVHITICLIMDNDKVLAKGYSVCSHLDQYNRKLGNTIARGRARKAMNTQANLSRVSGELEKLCYGEFMGVYYGK